MKIYKDGIDTGNATFETSVPSWEQWDSSHLQDARIVALENNIVAGWAAITPVSGRCVYAGVGEVSIYVSNEARGKGIGKKLLDALVERSEAIGLWTLQAGIFPENTASVKLHEQCGFRLVGKREKIGKRNNIWRDTLLFEKRSNAPIFD